MECGSEMTLILLKAGYDEDIPNRTNSRLTFTNVGLALAWQSIPEQSLVYIRNSSLVDDVAES